MKEVEVYLLLGSNQGDRFKNIVEAVKLLKKISRLKILECSSLYETQPEGVKEIQPAYLNMAIKCKTNLNPYELLEMIESIEKKMGRKNKNKKKPRVMDIDILMFGDLILKTRKLTIPHPQIVERKFVPYLLHELSPNLIHAELKIPITELIPQKTPSPMLYMKKEEIFRLL